MKILILRSINFNDEDFVFIEQLVKNYELSGDSVAVYNISACENLEHWAGYAITDYSNWSDIVICLDFPAALIKHQCKRIILTKQLPTDSTFNKAVNQAISESYDLFKYGNVNYDCPFLPENISEFMKLVEV